MLMPRLREACAMTTAGSLSDIRVYWPLCGGSVNTLTPGICYSVGCEQMDDALVDDRGQVHFGNRNPGGLQVMPNG